MTNINAPSGQLAQQDIVKKYGRFVSQPKTDFFSSLGFPVVQGKREGVYIYTKEGLSSASPPLKLLDCRTSGGVFNFGHNHPEIRKALMEGIELNLDIGDHHLISEYRTLLAESLANLLPRSITKTQFCVSGGEAIDLAIKLSRAFTKRKKIISAKLSYHGVTGLALAAGDKSFRRPFLWELSDFEQVTFGVIEELEQKIDESTAGVIFETIPATGGILIPPKGFFPKVRDLCSTYGALMIQDEVQTGLGRTGVFWGIDGGLYENEKVNPDIIVLAKGLSAGIYPMATVSYRPEIEEIFNHDPFLHISTTGGSELGAYITNKMLSLIQKENFLLHVQQQGKKLKEILNKLQQASQGLITDIRGRGLMWGIEFISENISLGFMVQMLRNGIFADYCGNKKTTIKLMPPLIIEDHHLDELQTKLFLALKSLSN